VSFVLIDVVDATELWEQAPDEMAKAIARHELLLTAAVQAEGGVLLKARDERDSSLSVFLRAADAVRAGHRLQAAVQAEVWPAAAVIRTRVAVHTGKAVERDGEYFGPAVNRVARLRGVARGGEVVVSASTAAVVSDALPAGWELVDVGAREHRGLGPKSAFLLAAPDLDSIERRSPLEPGVSRREAEVLALVVESRTNAEIAARLFISERTVESHVSALLRKLDASDRRDLVRRAHTRSAPEPPVRAALLPPALELLADPDGFVGRVAELDLLRDRWQSAVAGHTLFVVVAAEAGMGKSRLVAELSAEVDASGGRVLFGACYEDVPEPYGPFLQAIADAVESGPGDVPIEVARVLPGSATQGTADADELSAAAEVIDGIGRWLTKAAGSAPLLLVIEDVHWSTATTRDVLRQLVRTAGRSRLLVAMTTRDTAPDLGPDVASLLADLERSPTVTRVDLRGLDRDEVAELAGVAPDDADTIVADSGGNPLLIAHMTADGRSASLSALLARRDARLDDRARGLLDLAATFGSEFDADLLAAGSGLTLLDVLESLEEAEAAGLVAPLPARPGRFAFVHALFRSHRYEALPLRRRLDLHASAANALASSPDDGRLSERARHACLAVPVGDANAAVALAREAAHEAEHAYAYDEAAAHYRRALQASRSLDPPEPRTSLDLNVRIAAAIHRSGDPEGLPMLLAAARQARHDGDDAALVRAAISMSHLGATIAFGRPDDLGQIAVVEDALAAVGTEPTAMRARLLTELAVQLGDGRVEQGIAMAKEAESIARALGDPDVLGFVLLGVRHVGRHPSRLEDHLHRAVELEQLGHRSRSLALTLAGLNAQALLHLERGELSASFDRTDRFLRLLDDRHLPFFQITARVQRANRALLDGQLERAEELAMETVPLAKNINHPPATWVATTIATLRRLQGRDAETIGALERIVTRGGDTVTIYRGVLAATQARSGSLDDARRSLCVLRDAGYPFPLGYAWTLAMSELAEAADLTGDAEVGAHVLSGCSSYASWLVVPGTIAVRPIDQVLAQAALAAGDAVQAEAHASRAVAASRRNGTPVFLVRDLVFLAEARRRSDAPSAEVRALVREALDVAEPLGIRVVAADVERFQLES
jgi:class 3 adenylate cyclase